jgi:hypothetical protein
VIHVSQDMHHVGVTIIEDCYPMGLLCC